MFPVLVKATRFVDVDYIAVRTDDWQRGTTENNIIVRAGTGVVQNFNHIINNIFVDTKGEVIRMRFSRHSAGFCD